LTHESAGTLLHSLLESLLCIPFWKAPRLLLFARKNHGNTNAELEREIKPIIGVKGQLKVTRCANPLTKGPVINWNEAKPAMLQSPKIRDLTEIDKSISHWKGEAR
jgi:hypothetical protein